MYTHIFQYRICTERFSGHTDSHGLSAWMIECMKGAANKNSINKTILVTATAAAATIDNINKETKLLSVTPDHDNRNRLCMHVPRKIVQRFHLKVIHHSFTCACTSKMPYCCCWSELKSTPTTNTLFFYFTSFDFRAARERKNDNEKERP